MIYKANGVVIKGDSDYVAEDGTRYPPAAWKARMDELGITSEPRQVKPDDRLYVVQDNGDGTYDVTPRPPGEMKQRQLAWLNDQCELAIASIRSGYPESEVLSWTKQEAEARAFVADSSAATPLLDALADARAVPKAILAARVIAKADAFAAISGALIGKRQRLEDAINALPVDASVEQVAAVVW